MDLTTTKSIKRRIINISPDPTKELTDCSITLSNWLQNTDTSNMKMRISSFYFNNSTLPAFIPDYIPTLLPLGFAINTAPAAPVPSSFYIDSTPAIGTPVLNNQILDYYINIYDSSTNISVSSYLYMNDLVSEYPELKPVKHASDDFEQKSNRYFWFFNTSKFCDVVGYTISKALELYFGTAPNICKLIRTSEGYGMYLLYSASQNYEIQFSQSLIDLFQFKSTSSVNSSYLRTIIFNENSRSYGTPTTVNAYVASNYVPDSWAPFEELLIKSDFPVESEVFYNNFNYTSQNYDNILLAYSLANNNPDGIYNYYSNIAGDAENWVTLVGTNSNENVYIETLLKLRGSKNLIPYTIKKKEIFRIVTETITTS
jgi:hypothetical protein